MSNSIVAVMILSLAELDNPTLAAANNGINAFGRINPQNQAYPTMLELGFIKEDGSPVDNDDLLAQALSYEVNDRVEKGTFS